jgi:hypothetical protein
MLVKRLPLAVAALIGFGTAPGCGNAPTSSTPLTPEAKAKAEATGNAVRDAAIRYSIQNSIPSSSPDYGSGFKF